MASLEALQRRLEGAEELQAIVKAMKAISAARIRQFRDAVESLRDYRVTLELGFQIALRERTDLVGPVPGPESPAVAVLFGADRGLAGQFNTRVVELALERLAGRGGGPLHLFAVGARVARQIEIHGRLVEEEFPAPGSVDGITGVVQDLLVGIRNWREQRGVERFSLVYHDYVGGATSEPRCQELLPVDPEWLARLRMAPWTGPSLPTHRTGQDALLASLLREHLFISLYRACAESMASENASRLAAMLAAESRIEERLTELRRRLQQERQESITQELLEVVAGFEVLSTEAT